MTKLIFFYIRATFHPHFLFLGTKKFSSLGAKNFLSLIFNPTGTKKIFLSPLFVPRYKKLCWFLFTLNKVQNGREDENLGLELRKVVPYIEKSIRNSNFKVSHELSKCPTDCSKVSMQKTRATHRFCPAHARAGKCMQTLLFCTQIFYSYFTTIFHHEGDIPPQKMQ